jgi:hypothetical protein
MKVVKTRRLSWCEGGPMPAGWAIGANRTVWLDNTLMGCFMSATFTGKTWKLTYTATEAS